MYKYCLRARLEMSQQSVGHFSLLRSRTPSLSVYRLIDYSERQAKREKSVGNHGEGHAFPRTPLLLRGIVPVVRE